MTVSFRNFSTKSNQSHAIHESSGLVLILLKQLNVFNYCRFSKMRMATSIFVLLATYLGKKK